MVWPMATMPWVRTFCRRQAAMKPATAMEPKRLTADCMTTVPTAVTENWRAMGTPMRSWCAAASL